MKRIRLSKATRLTSGGTDHDHPVFSPDGRWIVFAAGRYRATDLYLMDRRGRFARRLTDGPGNKSQPCFAPDGTRVAYCVQAGPPLVTQEFGHADAPSEIVAIDIVPDSRPVSLAGDGRSRCKQPAFSPDGRKLAYFSDAGTPGNYHLFILDFETGRRQQVTHEPGRNDCHPAWAPDGRRLAFHAYEGLEADRANIYVIDVLDGVATRVTDRPGLSKHPCFANDRLIVFHREEPGDETAIYAVDVDTSAEARLTPAGIAAKQPSVGRSRKGRLRVAYAAREDDAEKAARLAAGRAPVFDIHVAELRIGK